MDMGLLGAFLAAGKQGYDQQDALSRKRRDDDAQQARLAADDSRRAQAFQEQQAADDQQRQLQDLRIRDGYLRLSDAQRAQTSSDHSRAIVSGFLQGQSTGDWNAFKDAYNATAGQMHGHQVSDLSQNNDGSFTATLDNGTQMPIGDQSTLLTMATRMASPDSYLASIAATQKAQDAGAAARLANPQRFSQVVTDPSGRMGLVDLESGEMTPITDPSGNAFAGTIAGRRPVARLQKPRNTGLAAAAVQSATAGPDTAPTAASPTPDFSNVASQGTSPLNSVHAAQNLMNPGVAATLPKRQPTIVRSGTDPASGRRVVQYDDGSVQFAQ